MSASRTNSTTALMVKILIAGAIIDVMERADALSTTAAFNSTTTIATTTGHGSTTGAANDSTYTPHQDHWYDDYGLMVTLIVLTLPCTLPIAAVVLLLAGAIIAGVGIGVGYLIGGTAYGIGRGTFLCVNSLRNYLAERNLDQPDIELEDMAAQNHPPAQEIPGSAPISTAQETLTSEAEIITPPFTPRRRSSVIVIPPQSEKDVSHTDSDDWSPSVRSRRTSVSSSGGFYSTSSSEKTKSPQTSITVSQAPDLITSPIISPQAPQPEQESANPQASFRVKK